MKWFVLLVGVVVVCFVVALVLGLIGGGMGRPTSSLSHEPLPDGELHDSDLDELRFDVGLRGYRMTQVDGVVDRLRRELREKDEQIAVLVGDPGPSRLGGPAAEPAVTETDAVGSVDSQPDAVGSSETQPDIVSSVESTDGQPADEQRSDQQTGQPQHSEPTV